MSPESNIRATIGENVSGQIAIGDHILQFGDVNGGTVNINTSTKLPAFSRRPLPVNLRPRPFPSLLDREQEFETVKSALQASVPISIYGMEGIGKTSFLKQLANLPNADGFPDGVIYLDAHGKALEDLKQNLFDAFYESQTSRKPSDTDILHNLKDFKALIVLDDLNLQRDNILSLLNVAPNCIFVLSTVERSLWGEGQIIPLGGLPEKEALALFERELGRSLNKDEKVATREIISLLQGHPLHIRQSASFVRDRSGSVADILSKLQNEIPEQALIKSSLSALSKPQENLLAILAASGGAVVPLDHLVSLSNDKNAQKTLSSLVALGLVQAHSPRYSLTGDLASVLVGLLDLTSWEGALITYFTNWLAQQPAQMLIEESADALINTIKMAGEKKQWSNVVRLGRLLENSLILSKRWQVWSDILNLILKAAEAIGDRKTEAWALHQLGSRAMCLGLSNAKQLLTQALDIRRAIGDRAGLAVTQHNLNTLLGVVSPTGDGKSGCRRCFDYGCGIAGVLGVLTIIIFMVWSWRPKPSTPPRKIPTHTIMPAPSFTSSPLPVYTLTATYIPTETSTAIPTSIPVPSDPIIKDSTNIKWNCQDKVTLGWEPSYSVRGIDYYEVSIFLDGQNVPMFFQKTPANSTEYSVPYDIKSCGSNFVWKVKATDLGGIQSNWSQLAYFYIGPYIPPSTSTTHPTTTNIPPSAPMVLFDFFKDAPSATWYGLDGKSNAVKLSFGNPPSSKGGALYKEAAYLEDGKYHSNVLETVPYQATYGIVKGQYDLRWLVIKPGDQLVVQVGYLGGGKGDNVTFNIYFWNGDYKSSSILVGSILEKNDGQLTEKNFQIPKDAVISQSGWFILEVNAGQDWYQDWPVWLVARLERP